MSDVFEALASLIRFLTPFVPTLTGFALGWGLFEVTERRRAGARKRAVRSMLVAELQRIEAVLSSVVYRYAMGLQDPTDGVREFRWFVKHGKRRGATVEDPPQELIDLANKSDDDLVRAFRAYPPTRQPGLPMPLPALDAALGDPESGLTSEEWQWLGYVKWQAALVELVAADMREWLRFTFTLEDEVNHKIAEGNFTNARMWYAKRTKYMIDAVRDALRAFGASEGGPTSPPNER